jgi:hypothetical protein
MCCTNIAQHVSWLLHCFEQVCQAIHDSFLTAAACQFCISGSKEGHTSQCSQLPQFCIKVPGQNSCLWQKICVSPSVWETISLGSFSGNIVPPGGCRRRDPGFGKREFHSQVRFWKGSWWISFNDLLNPASIFQWHYFVEAVLLGMVLEFIVGSYTKTCMWFVLDPMGILRK